MKRLLHKLRNHALRRHRIRATVTGTAERPRLSVYVSNRHITAQVIDDTTHKTVAYVTTVASKADGSMKERAEWVGAEVAKKARSAKVKQVVFDRGGRLYHGRVQALADAARKEGLEF
ncbi:MAG TPA: 50S ribosomal protein L18 [Candidatus Saccharimonadales bacterium]|nr:50S ribosomal protein L18 [Candidatus Saccharimonadales bacterium]